MLSRTSVDVGVRCAVMQAMINPYHVCQGAEKDEEDEEVEASTQLDPIIPFQRSTKSRKSLIPPWKTHIAAGRGAGSTRHALALQVTI